MSEKRDTVRPAPCEANDSVRGLPSPTSRYEGAPIDPRKMTGWPSRGASTSPEDLWIEPRQREGWFEKNASEALLPQEVQEQRAAGLNQLTLLFYLLLAC